MNTLVNFELAKLLKEKGWGKNTYSNCWVKTLDGDIIHNKDRKDIPDHDMHSILNATNYCRSSDVVV